MAKMIATVGIDKLGRLVVPKKMRDATGLRPGDQLKIEVRGDELVLRGSQKPRALFKEDGLWVYDSGASLHADDVNRWIAEDRERRIGLLSGEGVEP